MFFQNFKNKIRVLFKCHRSIDNSIAFLSFYLAVKRLMIIKNLVVKIQNHVLNHESRPFKLNPASISKDVW